MTFEDYQKLAVSTAVYPGRGTKLQDRRARGVVKGEGDLR